MLRVLGAALCAVLTLSSGAFAQSYPSKPIRFIAPFPPGGSADTIARLLAQEMTKSFGQQVVVENRPGAGGNIGVELVAKSPPDGYTVGIGAAGALAINQSLMGKLPYDPQKDLAAVAKLADIPIVLAVANATSAASVPDLIAAAKAKPGTLSFASAGNGTAMHLSGELFKLMAGVDMAHVPYKGSSPAVTDLVSGQVPVAFVDLSSALPQIRAGRIRGLAVASGTRTITAPDLPTIAESGVPGYDAVGWFGVIAPAGAPKDAIAKLNAEIVRIMALPEVRDRALAVGAEPSTGTPEAFAAFIAAEIPKWERVVRASGATAN
ncbi:MAG TPA: tripartite tricarboxylate transporter substrate binding protein [Burkholderiales bacterium]|nr:tripartite tricarboxylate transporter substrate binding protein [Burkholderiales bacterium]